MFKGDYKPMPDKVTHIWEMLNLMSAITKDSRFEKVLVENNRKESVDNMCEFLDKVENRGIAKGRAEGSKNQQIKIIYKLYGKLGDAAEVADLLDIDEAEVKKVIAEKAG